MSWRPEETCSHLNSGERPSGNADVKNSKGVNNNNNDNCYGDISYHNPKMDPSNLNVLRTAGISLYDFLFLLI